MKPTASPTVVRFLTSSSGILTPNFSSALTTIVIIDSESMSRSSVKDLSGSTWSVSMPVSSLTISARPSRISDSLCAMRVAPSVWGSASGNLGDDDDLCRIHESGAKPDLEGEAAARDLVLAQHPLGGQRDGGRGGVGRLGDVARDRDVRRELQLLDHRVDDPHVRLVRDEGVEVVDGDAGLVDRLLGDRRHAPDRPPEDGLTRHA